MYAAISSQVTQHRHRLLECAHQVLAAGQVDGCLSAHRRIHLRQQAGGNLEIVQSTEIGRRRKTGDVSHHAAAQGYQAVRPGDVVLAEKVIDLVQRPAALGCLAVGKDKLLCFQISIFEPLETT